MSIEKIMSIGKTAARAFGVVLAFILVAAFGLVGCSSPSQPPAEDTESTADNQAGIDSEATFPITIKHVYGETVIKSKPERIVAIFWSNQDIPLALGVMPVGISEADYGVVDDSRMLPWTSEKIAELGGTPPVVFKDAAGIDFEAISDCKPDLILAAQSGITQEEYDLLSEMAPTIAYPGLPWLTSWRDTITVQATALGLKKEGEQLVADLETQIEDTAARYPQIEGRSSCFIYIDPADFSMLYIYTPSDSRPSFLRDLGMVTPASVEEMASNSDSFYLEVSAENADKLADVDVLVGYGDAALLEALQADPLFGAVPAIQRGSVLFIDDYSPLAAACSQGALSIPWSLEEYASLLNEAAEKVK
jgi:iron complex transport system substrate-binding protein